MKELKELLKEEAVQTRIRIPLSQRNVFNAFQDAYKGATGKYISIEHIGIIAMEHGIKYIKEKTKIFAKNAKTVSNLKKSKAASAAVKI